MVTATVIYAQISGAGGGSLVGGAGARGQDRDGGAAAGRRHARQGRRSVPHFKTDKERLEAALKEVDAFLAAEPHSPLRREAQLQKAGLLLDLQRPDEAIPLYTDVLGSRSTATSSSSRKRASGYAYEAKGDLDQALAAFAKLAAATTRRASTRPLPLPSGANRRAQGQPGGRGEAL